jgi:hypothetical protein
LCAFLPIVHRASDQQDCARSGRVARRYCRSSRRCCRRAGCGFLSWHQAPRTTRAHRPGTSPAMPSCRTSVRSTATTRRCIRSACEGRSCKSSALTTGPRSMRRTRSFRRDAPAVLSGFPAVLGVFAAPPTTSEQPEYFSTPGFFRCDARSGRSYTPWARRSRSWGHAPLLRQPMLVLVGIGYSTSDVFYCWVGPCRCPTGFSGRGCVHGVV